MQCPSTKWKDLSPEHERLRKELESYIESYVEGTRKEYFTYLIVAPYGSGKTELLRYLCNWCIEKDIPVVLVELREITEYLEKCLNSLGREKIHERDLPKKLEEFFVRKLVTYDVIKRLKESGIDNYDVEELSRRLLGLGSESEKKEAEESIKKQGLDINALEINVKRRLIKRRGVMLIDEVEEAYNDLKNLVQFTASPFRGFFEKVRNRNLLFLPILAFGPSTALMELSGLAGWRVRILNLPLLDTLSIERLLKERNIENIITRRKSLYIKLLTNMLWWLSKGRIGWLNRIVDEGIPMDILKNICSIEKGNLDISRKLYVFNEKFLVTLRSEVVEGTPLFNDEEYRRLYNDISALGINYRKLFPILTALVGPLPMSEVKSIIGVDFSGLKVPKEFVCTRRVISKSMIIDRVVKIAEKIVRSRKVANDVERVLDMVLDAWSYNDIILYDPKTYHEYMETLKNVAMSLALELYKEEIVNVLDKIDLVKIVDDLSSEAFQHEEEYCAINPSVLIRIYPPIMIRPLIACAKTDLERIKNVLHRVTIDELRLINKEISNLLNKVVATNLNVDLYHVPSLDAIHRYKSLMTLYITKLSDKIPLLIPVAISGKELDRLVEEMEREFKPYLDLGFLQLVYVSPALSLFLAGLVYSILNCSRDLDALTGVENYILKQYLNSYRRVLAEEAIEYYRIINNVRNSIGNALSGLEKDFEYLDGQGFRVLGAKRAEYAWSASLASDELHNVLTTEIAKFAELSKVVEDNVTILRELFEKDPMDVMFEGVRSLIKEAALKYVKRSIDVGKRFANVIEGNEKLQSLAMVLREVIEKMFIVHKDGLCLDFERGVNIALNTFRKVLNDRGLLKRSAIHIFLSYVLKSLIEYRCKEHMNEYTRRVYEMEASYQEVKSRINDLRLSIDKLLNEMKKLNVVAPDIETQLSNVKSFINRVEAILDNAVEVIMGARSNSSLSVYDFVILKEFVINLLLNPLMRNVRSVLDCTKLRDYVDDVLRAISDVEYYVKSLDEEVLEGVRRILGKDLREEMLNDLKHIFTASISLKDLANKLNEYLSRSYVSKIERTYREYVRIVESEGVDRDVERLKDILKVFIENSESRRR